VYEVWKQLVKYLGDALEQDNGWAWTNDDDNEVTTGLRDVVMSLEHRKNSVRWAAEDSRPVSGALSEALLEEVLDYLSHDNCSLYNTIRVHMTEIFENLEGVRNVATVDSSKYRYEVFGPGPLRGADYKQ
jgi:hypothetical protein